MARELIDGVWLFDLGFTAPIRSNAYLLDEAAMDGVDGEELLLCDVGLRWNRPSIRRELDDAGGYAPADIDRVLLTHYDLDHVGGLPKLLDGYDGPVYIGARDYDLATGATDPDPFHHKGIFHRLTRMLFPIPDDANVRTVVDGDRIGRITAYATPGHSPGHVVYVHDGGVALLGDLLGEEDGALRTPFWLDSYDMRELRESVVALADRVQPFEVAAMGHGSPIVGDGQAALERLAERL